MKREKKRMRIKTLTCLISVSFLLAPFFAHATNEETKYHLSDTGGDCQSIGEWNTETKTCKVTQDFNRGIEFDSDGITLDGNNHKIIGYSPYQGYLILLENVSGVTIKNFNLDWVGIKLHYAYNCTVENMNITNNVQAIQLGYADNNTIKDNTITQASIGMWLASSDNNKIIGNKISDSKEYYALDSTGIRVYGGNENTLEKNVIERIESRGIHIESAQSNIIKENTIKDTKNGVGLYLVGTLYDEVYSNNLIDNKNFQAFISVINNDVPDKGNYWSDFDEESEGCFDADNNGICDDPYLNHAKIAIDTYPHTKQFNWEDTEKTGNSNILFIPGIQASRLYEKDWLGEDQLWEPTSGNEDVTELYLDRNGDSVKSGIYTKDIVDEAYKSPYGIGTGFNIYKSFISFMDQMKTDGTIADWSPLPYDWRYSPEKVIQDGIVMDDGSIVNPTEKLEALANNSQNGKVTIISHSNGGIFAKLLISKLKEQGKENLVDKIIFVATPQMGTPKTLAGLLHGDELDMGNGIILNQMIAREFGENMSSAYNLLPTKKYFETVKTPVIEFSDEVKDIYDFRSIYGNDVDSFSEMKSFLSGDNGKRTEPFSFDMNSPNVLSSYLLGKTETLHDEIDNWEAPEGTKVIQIAGWGLDTIAGIKYDNCDMIFCDELGQLDRELVITMDGDETVVYPSALMMGDGERYYLNLDKYNDQVRFSRKHANILEIESLQDFIGNIVSKNEELTDYISKEIPIPDPDDKRLRLQMHSPVDVHLYDDQGRHTGLIENPNLDSDIRMYEEEIPNSYCWEFGETKYLGIGAENETKINLEGTGTGTFTFEIEEVSGNNETVSETAFKDIPVFEGMKADLNVDSGVVGTMSIDLEGDGKNDFSITAGDNEEKEEASILILDKILSNLTCHKSVKQPLTQRMVQVKKLYSQNKITPANNLLGAMISHLEAVEKRSDLSKLGISSEEIEKLIGIIEGVKMNN